MNSVPLHPDAPRMKGILDKHGITQFYHFTAVDNLRLVARCGGLWSKEKLEQNDLLDGVITGGADWSLKSDSECGYWDMVHLCFCPNTPMAYRVQQDPEDKDPQRAHICYLTLEQHVALWNGVYFTDTNATKKIDGHRKGHGLPGLKLVQFETIRAHLDGVFVMKEQWQRDVQAECLVPGAIPLTHVTSIDFMSEASRKEGERIWGEAPHPVFSVRPDFFHSGFPQVADFWLTSGQVTGQNVRSIPSEDSRQFSLTQHKRITLLVNLYATAGTQAKVEWKDSRAWSVMQEDADFETEGRYWHWPSIDSKLLNVGDFSVEYHLGKTRWFIARFKVGG
jgi:hypothetical protein